VYIYKYRVCIFIGVLVNAVKLILFGIHSYFVHKWSNNVFYTHIITFVPTIFCDIYAQCVHVCTNIETRVVFLFFKPSIPALEVTERPSKSVPRLPYLEVTRSGPETDHSHRSNAGIKASRTVHELHMPSRHAQGQLGLYIRLLVYLWFLLMLLSWRFIV